MTMYSPDRPYGGSVSPTPGPPRVRMEVIGEAWALLTPQIGNWVLLQIIDGLVFGAAMVGLFFLAGAIGVSFSAFADKDPNPIGVVLVLLVFYVGLTLSCSFFFAGIMRTALKTVRGQTITVNDLFSGGDVVWPLIGAVLLFGLVHNVVLSILVLPFALIHLAGVGLTIGFLLTLFLAASCVLAIPIIVDRRAGVIGALGLSIGLMRTNFGVSLLVFLVTALLNLAAALFCGFGLLATRPLAMVTLAKVYQDVFQSEYQAASIVMPLPSQSSSTERATRDGIDE